METIGWANAATNGYFNYLYILQLEKMDSQTPGTNNINQMCVLYSNLTKKLRQYAWEKFLKLSHNQLIK